MPSEDQSRQSQTTHPDYNKAGDIIDIPGAGGAFLRAADCVRYRYDGGDRTYCPLCKKGGAGVPWAGWFSCDLCGAIALVNTGEVFTRVSGP